MSTATLVLYSADSMTATVKKFYGAFGVDMEPEEFKAAKAPKTSDKIDAMAQATIDVVSNFLSSLGLAFPAKELAAKS